MNEKLYKHDYSGQLSCSNREVTNDPFSKDFCIPRYQYCEYRHCVEYEQHAIPIVTYQVWFKLGELYKNNEYIEYATVREADDEIHIECRASEGHKNAFIVVDSDCSELADFICKQINEFKPEL